MQAIIDTHTFLWFITDDRRLSPSAKARMEDPSSELWLSAASAWEIAIKASLNKLQLAKPFAELIPPQLEQNAVGLLPIRLDHLVRLAALPFHHRAPFDRLIIAQSLAENLPILGADAAFDAYGIERIW